MDNLTIRAYSMHCSACMCVFYWVIDVKRVDPIVSYAANMVTISFCVSCMNGRMSDGEEIVA